MIDWTKPIETVGGRAANLLTRSFWRNGETYCVVQIEDDDGNSEIVIINPTTGRCIKYGMQIRNASVKREGWVLMRPPSASMQGRYLANDHVYDTEAEAQSAKAEWYGADPGVKAVHLTWEE